MTRRVVLAACAPDEGAAGVVSAGRDLPGSVGGRGWSWDVTGEAGPVAPADADDVVLNVVREHVVPSVGLRIKRTLLLTVRAGTREDVVAEFEADLMAMPEHIGTIRSWALSRVDTAAFGPRRWTHAWEQEYVDVAGLTGEYLLNPYHWAHVDRWFDGEVPGSIVEPALAHVFRWSETAVLGG